MDNMSTLHFKISEWFVLDDVQADVPITASLSQKILQHHLLELNVVRDELGMPVYVRSGYRPEWWEQVKGRDGDSQHCYKELGATDVSIEKHSREPYKPRQMWLPFFRLLVKTSYKRITYYPALRFFHCDHEGDKRRYYLSRQGWEQADQTTLANIVGTSQNKNEGHNE